MEKEINYYSKDTKGQNKHPLDVINFCKSFLISKTCNKGQNCDKRHISYSQFRREMKAIQGPYKKHLCNVYEKNKNCQNHKFLCLFAHGESDVWGANGSEKPAEQINQNKYDFRSKELPQCMNTPHEAYRDQGKKKNKNGNKNKGSEEMQLNKIIKLMQNGEIKSYNYNQNVNNFIKPKQNEQKMGKKQKQEVKKQAIQMMPQQGRQQNNYGKKNQRQPQQQRPERIFKDSDDIRQEEEIESHYHNSQSQKKQTQEDSEDQEEQYETVSEDEEEEEEGEEQKSAENQYEKQEQDDENEEEDDDDDDEDDNENDSDEDQDEINNDEISDYENEVDIDEDEDFDYEEYLKQLEQLQQEQEERIKNQQSNQKNKNKKQKDSSKKEKSNQTSKNKQNTNNSQQKKQQNGENATKQQPINSQKAQMKENDQQYFQQQQQQQDQHQHIQTVFSNPVKLKNYRDNLSFIDENNERCYVFGSKVDVEEGQFTEYKLFDLRKTDKNTRKLEYTVSAMLNSSYLYNQDKKESGSIILGVRDNDRILEGLYSPGNISETFFTILRKRLGSSIPSTNPLVKKDSYKVFIPNVDCSLFYPILDCKGVFMERVEEGCWPISSHTLFQKYQQGVISQQSFELGLRKYDQRYVQMISQKIDGQFFVEDNQDNDDE